MKTRLLIGIALVLKLTYTSAQWTQKASLPSVARSKSSSFIIGTKLYLIGGMDNAENALNDFWEYDMTTDTWLQKPNFPGAARFAAVAFSIGNKGYYGTGDSGASTLFEDMWEYDPLTGIWTQKASIPDPYGELKRHDAISFTIGNKAYIGLGLGFSAGGANTPGGPIPFYDLYEFDPALNSWNQKADIPGYTARTMAIAVSINNKGYIGLGWNGNQTTNYRSMFEYDPVSDQWLVIANFPSYFSVDAGAFALNSKLYLVGGVKLSPLSLSSQFYQYDPLFDTWAVLPNFNGGSISAQFAVSDGTRAFVGTGFTGSLNGRNDLWEVGSIVAPPTNTTSNPPSTPTINTTGIGQYGDQPAQVVQVYPNPASTKITVNASQKILNVQIFDVAGSLVQTETNEFRYISVVNLSAGMYTIKINYTNGTGTARKFIKN